MSTEAVDGNLGLEHAVALLATAVVAAPLFRRLGLGTVLGYLAAGVLIGPFGLAVFHDPESILHVAELGVVMFLFLIGLEMRPAKLWALRKEIFGLGAAQVVTCATLLTAAGVLAGLPWPVAFLGGAGFVLSSTAIIMKLMGDSGEVAGEAGQRNVSILLFEDLTIVPLLAIVSVLAGAMGVASDGPPFWQGLGLGVLAMAAVILAGRYALDPMFGVLARSGAREVMTAAALLVVLGAALVMSWGGLSMAMGAFLAGVLLSDSVFRHQLEADVEPFRGILLALFFLGVGMSLDLGVVASDWPLVAGGVLAFASLKALGVFGVALASGAARREALRRAALFSQGGEFAFVLYAAALAAGVLDPRTAAILSAIVVVSMALTPIWVLLQQRLVPPPAVSFEGVESAADLRGRVLIIGFGRFAQVVSQSLLARGVDIAVIDSDVDMIRAAGRFGFKVYYGDGTRLDVLHASGAHTAEVILVCVDRPEATDRIVALVRDEFPHAKVFARSFDRGHAMRLVHAGVDYQLRELFESSIVFGGAVLRELGFSDLEVDETLADVRERDAERFELQLAGGIAAGRALMRNNTATPQPTPFTTPQREGRALNEEAAEVLEEARPDA